MRQSYNKSLDRVLLMVNACANVSIALEEEDDEEEEEDEKAVVHHAKCKSFRV